MRSTMKMKMNTITKKRTSSTIPFGYKLDSNNDSILHPVSSELEELEKVIPMIKERTLSLREASLYLQHKTGRYISHAGLGKIAKNYE
jgi:hypothetical protein